jgi:hypothetical protein
MSTHHLVASGINHHELVSDSTLHVVTMISNSSRYHSRYRIFREWEKAMAATPNVKLHVVEVAHGDRHFEVTDSSRYDHLQLRTTHELWQKEAAINRGVTHLLPRNWKYMAWVDADVFFSNSNWALETIHELQHYPVVQPWGECVDLGPHNNVLQVHTSFATLINRGERPAVKPGDYYYGKGHPGYAWACTRAFYEGVQGLMSFPILGAADRHMSLAMVNLVAGSVNSKMKPSYLRLAKEWQLRAYRITHGHIGIVPGHITHRWHGAKRNRFYRDRWQILIDNKFDPDHDIHLDHQGLWRFAGNKPHLEEDIRQYFRSRNEDSIDEV